MDFVDFRWDDRKSMNVDVTLACGSRNTVTGVTQNISNGGMYVVTNVADVDLYAHCMVSVKFAVDIDDPEIKNMSKNLHAMVAYKDSGGIGLMFYDNEHEGTV